MRRTILTVLIIILCIVGGHLRAKETLLKIPVTVVSDSSALENPGKTDFELTVNGKKEVPVEVVRKCRSLSQPAIKRNFILAFNLSEYSQQVSDGITAFVNGVLNQGDALVVWTPVKVHRIPAARDQKTCAAIEEIVKKDTMEYKKDLKNTVDGMERIFRRFSIDEAENFLNEFGREFNNYKSRYIFPNLLKTASVTALLEKEEGEKWLINFQEREIIPLLVEYRNNANRIRDHASNLAGHDQTRASVLYTALNEIDKAMLFSENFPVRQLVDTLSAQGLNYNVILFKNLRKKAEMGDTSSPDFEKILKEIASCTGGMGVVNPDLKEGLDALRTGRHIFYDLSFAYDGKLEDKQVEVNLTKPKSNLYYKKLFTAKEIETYLADLKEKRITITGFSLKDRILKFTVEDFKLDTVDNKKQGMIKILVQLIDDRDAVVYNTQNPLSSQKQSVSISLKMPEKYNGKFNVRISAFDFLSGKIAQLDKPEKL